MEPTEVRKAMTYLESKNGLKRLSTEYTEDALHRRFSAMIDELSGELQGYNALSEELDRTDEETDWNSSDKKMPLLAQKILAEKASLKYMRESAQKKYDDTVMYETWLNEYGDEFAQLYRIKDNHEKRGYDEVLEIREIDITDNGDVLTNDKYNKMNAYAPEPLTELVLHVTVGENEEDADASDDNPEAFGFNFGVMEFNQPNMPPQVKVQLSFDDETLESLDESKLKRVFAFCDSHGISVSDLQIRRFDGSLAEDLIREKIERILEKAQNEKENKNKLENKKEKAKEEVRHQELEAERQELLTKHKGKENDELSWENVSADVVPEHRVMKAVMAPMARDFVKQNSAGQYERTNTFAERQYYNKGNTVTAPADMSEMLYIPDTPILLNEKRPPVQTIARGVTAPENIPLADMAHEVKETPKKMQGKPLSHQQTVTEKDFEHAPFVNEYLPEPLGGQKPKDIVLEQEETPVEPVQYMPKRQNTGPKTTWLYEQTSDLPAGDNQQQSAPQVPPPPKAPKLNMSEAEEKFEKMFTKDWAKVKGRSYFKTHTGWFKSGWTEYVFYDTEDENNRKNDAQKQKDGSVKYTYSFKLFLRMEDDGLHFAYRTPNHRKIDESIISDIVNKLKSLGYTHINFPAGIPNAEKGMWRKAMAENGIVPLNLGLNVKHARDMVKAMKETEKFDSKAIAEYGLKLAHEMQRSDAKEGKTPNETRRIFINGLINTHKYFAFTNAYSEVLKSKIEGLLRQPNPQTGSPNKLAAYLTLRRVFEVYQHALANGNSLLNVPEKMQVVIDEDTGAKETITLLTPEEKRKIRDLGLGGNIQKLNSEQMEQLFNLLYTRQKQEEYNKLKNLLLDNSFSADRGPKIAPNVVFTNELGFSRGRAKGLQTELKSLGIDDFTPFEDTNLRLEFERFFTVDKPEYDRRHGLPSGGNSQSSSQDSASHEQEMPQNFRKNQKTSAAYGDELSAAGAKTPYDDRSAAGNIAPSGAKDMLQHAKEEHMGGKTAGARGSSENGEQTVDSANKKKIVVRRVKTENDNNPSLLEEQSPENMKRKNKKARPAERADTSPSIVPDIPETPAKIDVPQVMAQTKNNNKSI